MSALLVTMPSAPSCHSTEAARPGAGTWCLASSTSASGGTVLRNRSGNTCGMWGLTNPVPIQNGRPLAAAAASCPLAVASVSRSGNVWFIPSGIGHPWLDAFLYGQ